MNDMYYLFYFSYVQKNLDTSSCTNIQLHCCHCKNNYDQWKLLGVAVDPPTTILKLTLPYFICEGCFRKRFNREMNPKYMCGVAVLPLVDSISQLDNQGVAPSMKLPVTQSSTRVFVIVIDDVQPVTETHINQPLTANIPPPVPEEPVISQYPVSNTSDYGVDISLEEVTPDNPAPEEIQEEDCGTTVENEICYTLQFRQGGFFHTWLPSFFVLTHDSICMYPNDKRPERKKKEILLYDATVSVGVILLDNEQSSPVHTDSKHKYCVSIQPGQSSKQQKAFIVALDSKKEEEDFIAIVNTCISYAKQKQSVVENDLA